MLKIGLMNSLIIHHVVDTSVKTRAEPVSELRYWLNLLHLLSLRQKVLLSSDC